MITFYLQLIDSKEEKSKFELLYLTYKNLMLNRSYDILQDAGLAEDAVHNAFLRILKNMQKISDVKSSKSKAYVMVILENEAKRIYSKEHKVYFVNLDEDIIETGFEGKLEDDYNVEEIKSQINRLPNIYTDVFILKYFIDFTDKEIADSLSISVAAVRKRLLRGKQLLLSYIKDGA